MSTSTGFCYNKLVLRGGFKLVFPKNIRLERPGLVIPKTCTKEKNLELDPVSFHDSSCVILTRPFLHKTTLENIELNDIIFYLMIFEL